MNFLNALIVSKKENFVQQYEEKPVSLPLHPQVVRL